jgi:hypothetical protein
MSELLLQSIVENADKQNLLLQTISSDADKALIEQRKNYEDLSAKILLLQSSRIDPDEIKKLTHAVESLKVSIPQPIDVKPQRYLLLTKPRWIAVGMFVLFLAMSWCWGYTFKAWSVSEMDGVKYRYLQSIPNNSLARFCRQADSLYAINSPMLADSLSGRVAGEKEKSLRISTSKQK